MKSFTFWLSAVVVLLAGCREAATSTASCSRDANPAVEAGASPTGTATKTATTQMAFSPAMRISETGYYPIDKTDNLLRVPVTWNNKPGFFLVDTCCSGNAVDNSTFANLAVVGTMTGPSASSTRVEYNQYHPPSLEVGPVHLDRCGPVVRIDLSRASRRGEPPVLGLLGLGAIDCMAIEIDFSHSRFRFIPAFSGVLEPGAVEIPVSMDSNGLPEITYRVAGQTVSGLLDTGDQEDGGLSQVVFDRLSQFKAVSGENMLTSEGVSKDAEVLKLIPSLALAPGLEYNNIALARSAMNGVGMHLLARASVVRIDLAAKKLVVWSQLTDGSGKLH